MGNALSTHDHQILQSKPTEEPVNGKFNLL